MGVPALFMGVGERRVDARHFCIRGIMRKTSIFLVNIIMVCAGVFSCVSVDAGTVMVGSNTAPPPMREQAESGHWVSWPSGNQIIIIVVSNTMVRRESEIEVAKLEAARRISLFLGVEGRIESVNASGARRFFDHVNAVDANLDYDEDYQRYVEHLKFDPEKDVFRTGDAVFVQFKYDASVPLLEYPSTGKQQGRPDWTRGQNLPQFDGYYTAVGRASKQRWIKDTVVKSTDAAVFSLIDQVSMVLTEGITTNSTRTGGGTASSAIHTVSEGKLDQFLVLEYYIEPDTGTVYTLAIAKPIK